MTRKVLEDINDMFTAKKPQEYVNDDDVVRFTTVRHLKERFNFQIDSYLKKNKMNIGNFWKKDIKILTKDYNDMEKEVFYQQVMYHLETNFWKPLKRIKENWKSVLLKEIEDDWWTRRVDSGTDKPVEESQGEWSIPTPKKDDLATRKRKRIAAKVAAKKLHSGQESLIHDIWNTVSVHWVN